MTSPLHQITPVTLRIGSTTETFSNSRKLMERLDEIGKAKQVISQIEEGGESWSERTVLILTNYLRLCNGLDCFRRKARQNNTWASVPTKYGWSALKSLAE